MVGMASVALIGLICLSAGLAHQDEIPLQTNLIRNGKGAYEDYVLAGERVQGSIASTLISYDSVERLQEAIRLAEAKRGEDENDVLGTSKQLARLREALKALPSGPGHPTPLDIDRAIAKDFGPAWTLILRGNQKPRTMPRSKIDAETLFPEFAQFRLLARAAFRKARAEFANGNGSSALTTYRETNRLIQRIGNETLISRLVATSCEAMLFAEIERNLAVMPSSGLAGLIEDLKSNIQTSPRIKECLQTERDFFYFSLGEMQAKYESGKDNPKLEMTDPEEDADWGRLSKKLAAMPTGARLTFFKEAGKRLDDELFALSAKLNEPESKWPFGPTSTRPQSDISTFLNANALDFSAVCRIEAEARTRTRVAIITLLAREHAWQHGAYPANLKDFLKETATIDPLTNQPYKYSITNGAVVVKTAPHPLLGEISLRRAPRSDSSAVDGDRVILP